MTTFSKLCPKCSAPCDLAAPSCKKCGLRFGAPVETEAAEIPKEPVLRRPTVVYAVFGVLALIVVSLIVGVVQYQLREMHTAEIQRKDQAAHNRISAGKD